MNPEIFDSEDGQYRLTKTAKEFCKKLLNGATPSELGMDFADAFILLAALSSSLANDIEKQESRLGPEFRQRLIEFTEQVKDLAKMFKDAAIISGQFPE